MADGHPTGIGLYRGVPDAIGGDALQPMGPPTPATGYPGPSIALPLEQHAEIRESIDRIGKIAAGQGFDIVAGNATEQTDSSGNVHVGIYQVAAGVEAKLHRLIVNARVPATGLHYNPITNFTDAAAYLELYSSDQDKSVSGAGLLDFQPGPGETTPFLLPASFAYGHDQAPFVRGPSWYVLKVAGGPHSTSVVCRYQVALRRARGIA